MNLRIGMKSWAYGAPMQPPNSQAKLVIGTAQLGMPYGLANRTGRPSFAQALDILQLSFGAGICQFDTAKAYGDSEATLGRIFSALGTCDRASVVTKGSAVINGRCNLESEVNDSLKALGLSRLDAWLLHSESELASWNHDALRAADRLKGENKVASFGVSVYNLGFARKAIETFGFGAIQCPANPFDRRFFREEFVAGPPESGTAFYFRSIYLQGLCLMDEDKVPDTIPHAREAVAKLADFCAGHEVARDVFCLKYVLHRSARMNAKIVLGLESVEQLARNVEIFDSADLPPETFDQWDEAWPHDLTPLILPYLWKTN